MSENKHSGDDLVVQVDSRRPQAKQQVHEEKKMDDFSDLIEHLDRMQNSQELVVEQGTRACFMHDVILSPVLYDLEFRFLKPRLYFIASFTT